MFYICPLKTHENGPYTSVTWLFMNAYIFIKLLFKFQLECSPGRYHGNNNVLIWTAVITLDPPPPIGSAEVQRLPMTSRKKSMWGSAIFIPWYPKSEYLELLKSKFINTAGKRINYDTGIDMLPSSKLVTRVAVRILDRHFFMWMFSSGTWKHPRKFRENKGA